MSESPDRTYVVIAQTAILREAPTGSARKQSYLTRHKRFTGREVKGTFAGQATRWVERSEADGGGFVIAALLDEVP